MLLQPGRSWPRNAPLPPTLLQAASLQERDDAALIKWARGQRMYYGELLGPTAAARLEQLLAAAAPGEAQELLATLRQLHAVAQPSRFRSVSQQEHGEQHSTQVGSPLARDIPVHMST